MTAELHPCRQQDICHVTIVDSVKPFIPAEDQKKVRCCIQTQQHEAICQLRISTKTERTRLSKAGSNSCGYGRRVGEHDQPGKSVTGIESMANLTLPVVIVGDEARTSRALVCYAPSLLACLVYL